MADLIVRTGLHRICKVKTSTKRSQETQLISGSPLIPWQPVVDQPSTRAGQFVARRYSVAPAVADLIANLAGLGSEVRS
ncbi:hypothetical protein [Bradyrhizobium macuxiense]|uniref:hypothetical protein n=1 Tax=Bradyrhizobium macuxiense TaxID=1755647 RepID=UPI0010A9642F|nr:hypothetical protein [Bradyrhizobium macuxiense]